MCFNVLRTAVLQMFIFRLQGPSENVYSGSLIVFLGAFMKALKTEIMGYLEVLNNFLRPLTECFNNTLLV